MNLNPVSDTFTRLLHSVLPPACFREVSQRYLEEPRGIWTGKAGLVLAPATVEEVATIIKCAADARIAVIPYGGGTGLVGGQVAPDLPAPIVLSLERMCQIRSVHAEENVLIAEAGAILHDVHAAAESENRLFPLSLASEGSCFIGGNLATNAGGVNVLRYGNARDLCLGIEAVLPNGDILRGLKRLRKDNTGFDLRNLLIGSEGTLGVITAASLRLFQRPQKEATAMMVVPNPEAAVKLLSLAQALVGDTISAFELIYKTGLEFLAETMPEIRQPFDRQPEWMVLVDLGMFSGMDPDQALADIFELGLENGCVIDGVIAQNETQRQAFWALREAMPEANKRIGSIASTDISIPIGSLPEFVSRALPKIAEKGDFRVNCFGHVGDGNLHFNVFPPSGRSKSEYMEISAGFRELIHGLVAEYDGSFSAEHGVGRLKVGDLQRYGDPTKLAAMRRLKISLDPNGIMNPGAVLAL